MVLDPSQVETRSALIPPSLLSAPDLPKGCVEACPGCRHRTDDYRQGLAAKHDWLVKCLRFRGFDLNVEPVMPAPEDLRWGYRTRTCLHAKFDEGRWQFGLMRRLEVVAIRECPVHHPKLRLMLDALSEVLPNDPVSPLQLRFVSMSLDFVVLIVKEREVPASLRSVDWESFRQRFGLAGVLINLNPSAGHRVFASKGWHILAGEMIHSAPSIVGQLWVGPSGFGQLIEPLHRYALETAADFFEPLGDKQVVDLYSGYGVSMRAFRARGAHAVGVELSGEAAALALLNRVEILHGRVEHRIPQLQQAVVKARAQKRVPVVYANPPRTGIDEDVLDWLMNDLRPTRMAWLSCSPGTLARDLRRVAPAYRVARIQPIDFFPQTHHVETLVLLERDETSSLGSSSLSRSAHGSILQ